MNDIDERLHLGRGPRACEDLLFERFQAHMRDGLPADLARPILILVPSGSLRRQLLMRLTERLGPSLLGLEVGLLRTLAGRLLDHAGRPARPGAEYFDLFVKRAASARPALKRALDEYEDAYALCVGSSRDLASAGFDDVEPGRLRNALAALPENEEVARAHDILALLPEVKAAMDAEGLERNGDIMARAAALWPAFGEQLGYGRILIHGFADAPGQTRSFLRALLASATTEIILDLPPEPSDSNLEAPAAEFARRFASSLDLELPAEAQAKRLRPASWQAFDAVGREAEVREVAWRIEKLVRSGVAPERIGVVARNIEAYLPEIRRQFRELGLPFSGAKLGRGFHAEAQRAQALLDLVKEGARLDLASFFSLLPRRFLPGAGPAARADLEAALKVLGRNDLRSLAQLDLEGRRTLGPVVLPLVEGLGADEGSLKPERRSVPLPHLEAAREAARALVRWHEHDLAPMRLDEHAGNLASVLIETLHFDEKKPGPILETLLALKERRSPALDRREFRGLLGRAFDESLSVRGGGKGLGIQVLGTAQARALSFNQLFILGLNAKVFPAAGREDPVLGDLVRAKLRAVLPALGLHRDRPMEENFLFAQLMEAAPAVTLSWMRADDDGKELARSPFVERLVLAGLKSSSTPRALEERFGAARDRENTLALRDRLLLAALEAPLDARLALRRAELQDFQTSSSAADQIPWPDAGSVAEAQLDQLREIEAMPYDEDGRRRYRRLSPFFGATGRDRSREQGPLFITTLENVATCPWQAFLKRSLALENLPDPALVLPDIDGLLLGNTAHVALEFLFEHDEIKAGRRPEPAEIEAATSRAATRVANEAGLGLAGLVGVLTKRARVYVERAVELDWSHGAAPRVAEVEKDFRLEIPASSGGRRELRFRADRVDDRDEGQLITDYKTGSTISPNKTEKSRQEKHWAAIASGSRLQAAAYALAGGAGRYLFINPKVEDHAAIFQIERSGELAEQFERTTNILERAWSTGFLPPRLEDPGGTEPSACQYCDFEAACIRGDSAARRRLAELAQAAETGQGPELLADIWDVGGRSGAANGDDA